MNIAIVGATGNVGRKILEVLEKNYQLNLFSAQARESIANQIENKINDKGR